MLDSVPGGTLRSPTQESAVIVYVRKRMLKGKVCTYNAMYNSVRRSAVFRDLADRPLAIREVVNRLISEGKLVQDQGKLSFPPDSPDAERPL